jgi:hypothetical protein
MAFSMFPWRLDYNAAHAAVGPDGAVKIKTYAKLNQTHWLLFVSSEYQLVMELEVPPEAFHDSPERSGKLLDKAVRTMVATIEAMSLPAEGAAASGPALSNAEGVRAARKRHLRAILSRAEGFRNLGWAVSADGRIAPASRPAATTRPKEKADVASYAWAACTALGQETDGIAAKEHDPAVAAALAGFMQGIHLIAMSAGSDAFARVTRPGSDWRRLGLGAAHRVRNLGGRRVRIEVWACRLEDPITPLLNLATSASD